MKQHGPAREFGDFLCDVETLRSGALPETAVRRIRELGPLCRGLMSTDIPHECERASVFLRENEPDSESWSDIVSRTREAVAGNDVWSAVIPTWLADAAAHGPFGRVEVVVNPGCDFIRCLTAGGPGRAFLYLPSFRIELRGRAGGAAVVRLRSRVEWAGHEPVAVIERVHEIYPDPAAWVRARRTGEVADGDRRLLASLGLVDTLVKQRGEREESLVTLDPRGKLERRAPVGRDGGGGPVWGDREHVRRFLRRHRAELAAVADEFAGAARSGTTE